MLIFILPTHEMSKTNSNLQLNLIRKYENLKNLKFRIYKILNTFEKETYQSTTICIFK